MLRTREESSLSVSFLAFLCIACLLAAVGVISDSPITVVGAMVVGPEFGPLAALAVALVRGKRYLARRAVTALLVGFPVAMAITTVATLAFEAIGWVGLDPTNDTLTAEDHIIVARGRDYSDVAPIEGVLYGPGRQEIETGVDVVPVG